MMVSLFGKEQTKKISRKESYDYDSAYESGTNWDQSMDWDECHEQGLLIGLPGQW